MNEQKSLLINNQWLEGKGPIIESKNPVTQSIVWQGFEATLEEVDAAVNAARTAFPQWYRLGVNARKEVLIRYARLVSMHKEELAKIITAETGKPFWEANAEVLSVIGKIDVSLKAYDERTPSHVQEQQGVNHRLTHKPHGVLAVLGPYNFPAHLPNGHIVPALLAGNTVVLKPSELTPYTSLMLAKLWQEAGCPAGVLNVIQGRRDIGQALVQHQGIDGILFTGSYQTGKWLHEHCAGMTGKLLALEMGGNNPLLVFDVQDKQAAAVLTIQSAFITSGQRCTCARRLIIQEGSHGDAFLEALMSKTQQLKVDDPCATPEPFMGSVISVPVAEALMKKQLQLIEKGGKSLLPMKQLQPNTGLLTPGIIDMTASKLREDEEIFGPLLQVIRVKDFADGLREANHTRYGLSAGLISDNSEYYDHFFHEIRAGIVNWNRPTTGASSTAPFGGIGNSGNHRPSAFYAADYCAYPVAGVESTSCVMPHPLSPGMS